jgi:hypothetical protein
MMQRKFCHHPVRWRTFVVIGEKASVMVLHRAIDSCVLCARSGIRQHQPGNIDREHTRAHQRSLRREAPGSGADIDNDVAGSDAQRFDQLPLIFVGRSMSFVIGAHFGLVGEVHPDLLKLIELPRWRFHPVSFSLTQQVFLTGDLDRPQLFNVWLLQCELY